MIHAIVRKRPPRDRIYEYIATYYEEHGIAPSLREIQQGADVSSTSVVSYNIHNLIRSGRLRKINSRGSARNVIPANPREPS